MIRENSHCIQLLHDSSEIKVNDAWLAGLAMFNSISLTGNSNWWDLKCLFQDRRQLRSDGITANPPSQKNRHTPTKIQKAFWFVNMSVLQVLNWIYCHEMTWQRSNSNNSDMSEHFEESLQIQYDIQVSGNFYLFISMLYDAGVQTNNIDNTSGIKKKLNRITMIDRCEP